MMKSRNKRKIGDRFEGKVQKSINSGATWFSPLDLGMDKYAIEAKYTDKKGFRIPLSLVEKIWSKALDLGKEPLLSIGIRRNDNQIFVLNCQIRLERKC